MKERIPAVFGSLDFVKHVVGTSELIGDQRSVNPQVRVLGTLPSRLADVVRDSRRSWPALQLERLLGVTRKYINPR